MLRNIRRSPANGAGEREALDDGRAGIPERPRAGVERGAGRVDVVDQRHPRGHLRRRLARNAPRTLRRRAAVSSPRCGLPQPAPARAGRRPAAPTCGRPLGRAAPRDGSRAGSSATNRPAPSTRLAPPPPSRVAIVAPAGPARARRGRSSGRRTRSRPPPSRRWQRPPAGTPAGGRPHSRQSPTGRAVGRPQRAHDGPGEVRQTCQAVGAERLLGRPQSAHRGGRRMSSSACTVPASRLRGRLWPRTRAVSVRKGDGARDGHARATRPREVGGIEGDQRADLDRLSGEPSAPRGTGAPPLEPLRRRRRSAAARTVSGEDGPGRVLERLELGLAVGLDHDRAPGERQRVEDELLELDGVRIGGSTRLPCSSTYGTRFSARWKGSSAVLASRVDELDARTGAARSTRPRAPARRRGGALGRAGRAGRSTRSRAGGRRGRRRRRPSRRVGLAHDLRGDLGAGRRGPRGTPGSAIATSGLSTWR